MVLELSGRSACVAIVSAATSLASTAYAGVITPGLFAEAEAIEWLVAGPSAMDDAVAAGPFGPLDVAVEASFPGGKSTTTTRTVVDYGLLKVITDSVGIFQGSPGQLRNAQGLAHASFREDSVVVQAAGFGPGQFGSFTARFEIQHFVNFLINVLSNNGGRVDISGGFQLEVIIGDATPGPYGGTPWTASTVNPPTAPSIPSGIIEVPVNFEYGVPFTIAADIEANLFTSVFGDIQADIDASMSLCSGFIWRGIDTTGLPEDVTVSSEHVEDWILPGSPTIALLPIAFLASRRRRA